MQIWLDTANPEIIKRGVKMGVCSGVTTNPSILAKTGESLEDLLDQLLQVQTGPVAVQVTASNEEAIVLQGKALRNYSDRILVKIPVTQEGLSAMRTLAQSQIPVMATAIVHPSQAILASHAGVHFLAPYFSDICDEEMDGIDSLNTMLQFIRQYRFPVKMIATSITSKEHIAQCAYLGLDAVTISEPIFNEWVDDHPITKAAIHNFDRDWKKGKKSRSLPL